MRPLESPSLNEAHVQPFRSAVYLLNSRHFFPSFSLAPFSQELLRQYLVYLDGFEPTVSLYPAPTPPPNLSPRTPSGGEVL